MPFPDFLFHSPDPQWWVNFFRRLTLSALLLLALATLLGWLLAGCARGEDREEGSAYPLGEDRGSAVGSRRTGWCDLTHRVDRLPNGLYRYRLTLHYKGPFPKVTLHSEWADWSSGEKYASTRLYPGEPRTLQWDDESPPVWVGGRVFLGVPSLSTPKQVVEFWQRGPVPARLAKKGVAP